MNLIASFTGVPDGILRRNIETRSTGATSSDECFFELPALERTRQRQAIQLKQGC